MIANGVLAVVLALAQPGPSAATDCGCAQTGVCTCPPGTCSCPGCPAQQLGRFEVVYWPGLGLVELWTDADGVSHIVNRFEPRAPIVAVPYRDGSGGNTEGLRPRWRLRGFRRLATSGCAS
jgi:hypothetical protein